MYSLIKLGNVAETIRKWDINCSFAEEKCTYDLDPYNQSNPTEQKVTLLFKKREISGAKLKKFDFKYHVNKTHKHLKWVLKSILPDQK